MNSEHDEMHELCPNQTSPRLFRNGPRRARLWLLFGCVWCVAGTACFSAETAQAQVVLPTSDKPKKKKKKCPPGQFRDEDTRGHCCWPGQVHTGARCVGVPTQCPSGRVVDKETQSCVLPACAIGQVRVEKLYCCWPGQGYSKRRDQCIGVPTECPAGFITTNDDCIAPKPIINSYETVPDSVVMNADEDSPDIEQESSNSSSGDDIIVPESSTLSGMTVGGWIAVGLGLVFVGGGGGMMVLAVSSRGEVLDNTTTDSNGSEVVRGITRLDALAIEEEANTFDTIGVIGLGVGGAVLIAGVLMLVLDDHEEVTPSVGLGPDDELWLFFNGRF